MSTMIDSLLKSKHHMTKMRMVPDNGAIVALLGDDAIEDLMNEVEGSSKLVPCDDDLIKNLPEGLHEKNLVGRIHGNVYVYRDARPPRSLNDECKFNVKFTSKELPCEKK